MCAAFELPVRTAKTFGPHDTPTLCRFWFFFGEEAGSWIIGGYWHWTSDTIRPSREFASESPANTLSLKITAEH